MAYPVPRTLAAHLRRARAQGMPLHGANLYPEAVVAYRDAPADASQLPASTRFLFLDRPRRLGDLSHLTAARVVVAQGLTKTQVPALTRLPRLAVLHLRGCALESLRPLAGAAHLTHLVLDHPRGLATLDGLAALPALETLYVGSAPRLRRLAPVPDGARPRLRGLVLTGGWSSAITLDSLGPLAGLRQLQFLELWVRVKDASLRPLQGLRHLRHVEVNSAWPSLEEIARVRAALPRLNSERLQPYVWMPQGCPRCDGLVVQFAGRRGRFVCPRCQPGLIEAHLARFEALVAEARRGRTAGSRRAGASPPRARRAGRGR